MSNAPPVPRRKINDEKNKEQNEKMPNKVVDELKTRLGRSSAPSVLCRKINDEKNKEKHEKMQNMVVEELKSLFPKKFLKKLKNEDIFLNLVIQKLHLSEFMINYLDILDRIVEDKERQ